jgi:CheY-like chemotaxis protein
LKQHYGHIAATANRALNFLIADDDPDDHTSLQKVIWEMNHDHKITSVFNGLQMVDYILRRGVYTDCKEPAPDCVFLDLNMPLLDGKQALQKLHRYNEFDALNVFILTTSICEKEKKDLISLGAKGFYTKSPEYHSLKKIVKAILIKI